MKEAFEMWILAQFGGDKRGLLSCDDDGYCDVTINAMWIGFNAGARFGEEQ